MQFYQKNLQTFCSFLRMSSVNLSIACMLLYICARLHVLRYQSINTSSPDSVDRNGVRAGIKHWEENTCLRFKETTSTTGSHLVFIISSGCWSYLGRLSWNGQNIGLARGCTNSVSMFSSLIESYIT